MDRFGPLDALASFAASAVRGGRGTSVARAVRAAAPPLDLYDMEGCPDCRLVRERLTELDLNVRVLPCPIGGTAYRPQVPEIPFLVDANRSARVGGAAAILDYLSTAYGDGRARHRLSRADAATSRVASRIRAGRGVRARPSRRPDQPLELYSFEASPFARRVREVLTELELPYLLHNVGKGALVDWLPPKLRARVAPNAPPTTAHRRELFERAGRVQVPYLVDPNTGVEMFESAAIVDYLERTYAA